MKKLSFIVMACLVVLGLTQCKKNEPSANDNADNGDRVSITLRLDNGGQRVHPEEENGLANVVYDNGDVVYVGSNGKYMGYLTYNGSLFTGSINAAATEGQPLQFIFLGGRDFHASLTENSTQQYTFSIGDQSNGLAVVSCAASNENFSATKLDYTAYLRNKCALVKFDLGVMDTDIAITLNGMKTEVTVGFDGTVTNGSATGGILTNGTGTTRYAVVLSDQPAVTNGILGVKGYDGSFSMPTAAYTNAFLTNATMTLTFPQGALGGKFTINANGDQVYFSKGNLQYNKTTSEWSFMEHQYDKVETKWQHVGENYADQSIVSLFGWGTSGYDHGANCYQPWSTDNTNSNNYRVYGDWHNNLYDQTGKADWGYNAISNGGNVENRGWRTLTYDEWVYLLNNRSGASSKYGYGTVNGVNGLIILPDAWSPAGFTSGNSNWANVYTTEQWEGMEANGAVFLPAAGSRSGDAVSYVFGQISGSYWSASNDTSLAPHAFFVQFYENKLTTTSVQRFLGCSVRLVRDAQ